MRHTGKEGSKQCCCRFHPVTLALGERDPRVGDTEHIHSLRKIYSPYDVSAAYQLGTVCVSSDHPIILLHQHPQHRVMLHNRAA